MERFFRHVRLEIGLVIGALSITAGLGLVFFVVQDWWRGGFADLDYEHSLRWVVPGTTLVALGFLTVLASFFISILGVMRK